MSGKVTKQARLPRFRIISIERCSYAKIIHIGEGYVITEERVPEPVMGRVMKFCRKLEKLGLVPLPIIEKELEVGNHHVGPALGKHNAMLFKGMYTKNQERIRELRDENRWLTELLAETVGTVEVATHERMRLP